MYIMCQRKTTALSNLSNSNNYCHRHVNSLSLLLRLLILTALYACSIDGNIRGEIYYRLFSSYPAYLKFHMFDKCM